MTRSSLPTRTILIVLAALLALPLANADVVSLVEAKKRSRSVTRTFANSALIFIPDGSQLASPVSAEIYPSPIVVSGLKGKIRDVNVRLNGFGHLWSSEVQMVLVGPRGQTAIVMAGVGGNSNVTELVLRLDDEAGARLPSDAGLQSGAFRPTNATTGAIPFNAPAPEAGANAALAIFDDADPNGTWRLFIQDSNGPKWAGSIADGWELEITTRVKAKKKRR